MSWITDAQDKAEEEKIKANNQLADAGTARERLERQKIEKFLRVTLKTRNEIEEVLRKARKQGLLVRDAQIGYLTGGSEDEYLYCSEDYGDQQYGYYSYAISWEIKETNTGRTLDIVLRVKVSKVLLVEVLKPLIDVGNTNPRVGINSGEIESKIKSWLNKIYSR